MKDLSPSSNNSSNCPATLAADLLRHYSFELSKYDIEQQIEIWLEYYPDKWLPVAIIEALYQGRYKVISVEQILEIWQRREQPIHHFNHEFERLVCGNLPRPIEPLAPSGKTVSPLPKPTLSYRKLLLELPSLRAASKLERLKEIPSIKTTLTQPFLNSVSANSNGAIASSTEASEVQHPDSNGSEVNQLELNGSGTNGHHAYGKGPEVGKLSNGKTSLPKVSDREFQEFKEGVVFGLSSGLAVQALKPRFRLEFSHYYRPNWVNFLNLNAPIDQFAPSPDKSPFHSKLKLVAQTNPPNENRLSPLKREL